MTQTPQGDLCSVKMKKKRNVKFSPPPLSFVATPKEKSKEDVYRVYNAHNEIADLQFTHSFKLYLPIIYIYIDAHTFKIHEYLLSRFIVARAKCVT